MRLKNRGSKVMLGGLVLIVLGLSPSGVVAASDPWPGTLEPLVCAAASGPAIPTRADLAQAYLRFEHSWQANTPPADRLAEFNARFDAATTDFFGKRPGEAIRALIELDWALQRSGPLLPDIAALASLRVRPEPRVWNTGIDTPLAGPALRISSLYDTKEQMLDLGLVIQLRAGDDSVVLERSIIASFGPGRFVDATLPLGTEFAVLGRGTYTIWIGLEGNQPVPIDVITVVHTSLASEREELLALTNQISPPDDIPPDRPGEIVRRRIGLITDTPSLERTVDFVNSPLMLLAQSKGDQQQLSESGNPFRKMTGDYWRTLWCPGGALVPLRVYGPRAVVYDRPLPLVIALHGAGGDENMFMQGYGAGRIKRLADQLGFLVATPSTIPFTADPANFDRLVEDLAQDYTIDYGRVYVVGHSLGAIAAAKLAAEKHASIAGVACIAGFEPFADGVKTAPTLVVCGALDPIFSAKRVQEAAERAKREGHDVELRTIDNAGHTLIVSTELDATIKWLLAHNLAGTPPAEGAGTSAVGAQPR